VDEVYAPDRSIIILEQSLSSLLCGASRPGHFDGVCTIVAKLFNLVQPDDAIFGKKDYQQLAIIRRMVRDLNVPVHVIGIPTVREPSGLAMSSRNAYLSEEEKQRATAIYRGLLAAKAAILEGERDFVAIEARQAELLRGEGFKVDYFAIRRLEDLAVPTIDERHLAILVAAWLGRARLIDNIHLCL
jgi:pantoate--beta-alanine ligase